MTKVLVIGLDCVPPELVFERYEKELPNISRLASQGIWGTLRSSTPPSSTNAWASMATSRDSSAIGIYDYVYRLNRSYKDIGVINSTLVKDDCVWDVISKNGRKVIVVNVPMTYPPKPVNGLMISGILTPENAECTYPVELQKELDEMTGGYRIKVPDPRLLERAELMEKLYELTKKRFKVIRHLINRKEWDFFMAVIYSTDAMMHNFWRYIDNKHRKHEPDSEFRDAIKDFLIYVDEEIGSLLKIVDDDTAVVLMSDHGAHRMDGRVNVNEWLMREGYLHLKRKPKKTLSILSADVDWGRTRAFALGAYYASIYLNVKGRDPKGIVEQDQTEALKKELIDKLKNIRDDRGRKMDTIIFEPKPGDSAPDLLVYFDNLHWGANSMVGSGSLYSWATEKGPDDAVHSTEGFFIISGKGAKARSQKINADIRDISPTVLKLMGIRIPDSMEGSPVGI